LAGPYLKLLFMQDYQTLHKEHSIVVVYQYLRMYVHQSMFNTKLT